MTTKEISYKLGVSENYIKKYKGNFRYHKSYFYKHGIDENALIELVKNKIPNAIIIDSGDHYHSFVGGVKSGSVKDSYLWVTFKVDKGIK